MAYKKMVEIAPLGIKKFVYKGEHITFCISDDFNDEFKMCDGLLKYGEVVEEKKKFLIESYEPRLDKIETYELDNIKVLGIHISKKIRTYFDNIKKKVSENEEDEKTDD